MAATHQATKLNTVQLHLLKNLFYKNGKSQNNLRNPNRASVAPIPKSLSAAAVRPDRERDFKKPRSGVPFPIGDGWAGLMVEKLINA